MSNRQVYIEPLSDTSELTAEARALTEAVLQVPGVEGLYSRVSTSGKVARALGAAAATVRSAVTDLLTPDDAPASGSAGNSGGSSDSGSESEADAGSAETQSEGRKQQNHTGGGTQVFVRIGTARDVVVTETAQQVARVIREHLGENVEITLDVVQA